MLSRRTLHLALGALLSLGALSAAGTSIAENKSTAEDKPAPSSTGTETDTDAEAVSFLGKPLKPPKLAKKFRSEQRRLLKQALADLAARPDDPEAVIWAGRRTAYLGRYREAIEIYSRGIATHPDHAALRRHRGHRYITLRRLDEAIGDLTRAAELIAGTPDEIEADGLPNARNTPTSTLQSNIWYHLGLAYFLQGNVPKARKAFEQCLDVSTNPDMLSATSYWYYLTLRRQPRHREAKWAIRPIHAKMDIIENQDYHRLLMMFKGQEDPEKLLTEAKSKGGVSFATIGYGVGNAYLLGGDPQRAKALFRAVVDSGSWAAFGSLAAEADLSRAKGVD